MRTRVLVAALAGAGGRTYVSEMRAEGQLAVRSTDPPGTRGAARVHLIGTAAGPLSGDEVVVRVEIGPGAALELGSAAAAVALPARGVREPARIRLEAVVAAGGRLDVALEPVVVCRGAQIDAVTCVVAEPGAHVSVREVTVIGRYREHGGDWVGRMSACVDGVPVLRSSLRSGSVLPDGSGAVLSWLHLHPGEHGGPATVPVPGGGAVRTPLAGPGTLVTSWGRDLADVVSAARGIGARHAVRGAVPTLRAV